MTMALLLAAATSATLASVANPAASFVTTGAATLVGQEPFGPSFTLASLRFTQGASTPRPSISRRAETGLLQSTATILDFELRHLHAWNEIVHRSAKLAQEVGAEVVWDDEAGITSVELILPRRRLVLRREGQRVRWYLANVATDPWDSDFGDLSSMDSLSRLVLRLKAN